MQKSSSILKQTLPGITAGFVIGILIIFIEISFASMIFSSELNMFLARGVGITLFGALIIGLITVFTSSFVGAISLPQDAPTAIMAVIAAAIAAEMRSVPGELLFATVMAALVLSALLTGGAFWLMGQFNLGRLVRFLPYPVIGGFLAGTGWMLFTGGIGVMSETPFDLTLLNAGILIRWLPGLIFALTLFFILRRYSHFLIMPSLLFAGVGVFYLVYYLNTGNIESAGANGWLLGPFPPGRLWQPAHALSFLRADWGIVLKHVAAMGSVILISTVSLLLNASGLEVLSRDDIDLNRELKSSALANLFAGFSGSPTGYPALSLSALANRLGGRNRTAGITAAIVIAFVLFFGASTLSIFPKMVAGGFLVFLGLSFLVEWVYDAWFKLSKLDYALVWIILLTIVSVGFLEGVGTGILIAIFLFAFNYSNINVIRHAMDGRQYRSHVMRPYLHQNLLREKGDRIQILTLQGYIFFGSAQKLLESIQERIANPELENLKFLVLDFRLVTGIDSTATYSFVRIKQLVDLHKVGLVLTHLGADAKTPTAQALLSGNEPVSAHLFAEIDQGVAWCEDQIIRIFTEVGLIAKPKTLFKILAESLPIADKDRDWSDYLNPFYAPDNSATESHLSQYFSRRKTKAGEILIREDEQESGLYFVERGKISAQIHGKEVRLLESGTVFGEVDYYTGQKANARYIADIPSELVHISTENLVKMEDEDPALAIAFHRFIAGILGKKLIDTSDSLRAFQQN